MFLIFGELKVSVGVNFWQTAWSNLVSSWWSNIYAVEISNKSWSSASQKSVNNLIYKWKIKETKKKRSKKENLWIVSTEACEQYDTKVSTIATPEFNATNSEALPKISAEQTSGRNLLNPNNRRN